MRTKSEARRQAIVDAATAVFQETGFERASMAQICERMGCSKATLYSYFVSKEELFVEVVLASTLAEFEALLASLDTSYQDVARSLDGLGRGLLALLYSPQVRAGRRLIVADAGRAELGRRLYDLGPARGEAAIAAYLAGAMERGLLRQAEPRVAANHLKGLLEAEWIDRFLFHVVDEVDDASLADTARRAVEAFLRAYAPETARPAPKADTLGASDPNP
ncbi:TetR/AcrR family transcriptional regulator [Rubrivivax gelatinosus]|uniref:TetR family transcriptional regulator n=1 Tax=Rubrivivax gelatinosus TaxID=28068 RepID=A0A4R2MU29_RUBGE|nr:TetR/AcrR family transcriptional regulator [Rubrivivax gelatinosus]MBK1688994.1 TetR family transcriptional regulator [Rubrivivax gelatinosus]TCP03033.1 TetR family transcriptional regulator [Rubrivivax gelatinosus]